MHDVIWPQCDLPTTAQCFKEALLLGPKPGVVRRKIFAVARATVSTGDVRAFMLAQQGFDARLLRLVPTAEHPDTSALANLLRILDGLTPGERRENAYLVAKWEDTEEATRQDVHRIAAKIIENSGKIGAPSFFAGSASAGVKSPGGLSCCPAHPDGNHDFEFCDDNPATQDPAGRDRRLTGNRRRDSSRQQTPAANVAAQLKAANK